MHVLVDSMRVEYEFWIPLTIFRQPCFVPRFVTTPRLFVMRVLLTCADSREDEMTARVW